MGRRGPTKLDGCLPPGDRPGYAVGLAVLHQGGEAGLPADVQAGETIRVLDATRVRHQSSRLPQTGHQLPPHPRAHLLRHCPLPLRCHGRLHGPCARCCRAPAMPCVRVQALRRVLVQHRLLRVHVAQQPLEAGVLMVPWLAGHARHCAEYDRAPFFCRGNKICSRISSNNETD